MRSEGYGSVCVSVCVSVKSHLTYGASVRPENAVTYSAGNKGQKSCGVFSETAPLPRSSTPSVVRPCVQSAIFPAEITHAHYSIYRVRFLALRVHYLRRLSLSISRSGLAIEIQRRGFSTLVLFIIDEFMCNTSGMLSILGEQERSH